MRYTGNEKFSALLRKMKKQMELTYLGNKELLSLYKTAFFCSRTVNSGAVLRCYDWATSIDLSNTVIISGFQSKIEKDILHLLLKRNAKIILVLARSIYKIIPQELQNSLDNDRSLIVSTAHTAIRTSKSAAKHRNEYIAQTCDELVFGYIGEGSCLQLVYQKFIEKSNLLTLRL